MRAVRAPRLATMLAPALALIAFTATQARAFNVTNLEVPRYVTPDQEEVEIECTYEGNFTQLSWFKAGDEFFRYKPGSAPSTRYFPILGVGRVDMIFCGPVNCRLKLGSLTDEATGLYKCEIDRFTSPSKVSTKSAYMHVYWPQHQKPIVEGLAKEYGEGDEIIAYCRAAPDAAIRWYINGHEMIEMRGLKTFKKKSSSFLFLWIPPKVCVQCAMARPGKYLSGSKEVLASWRNNSIKKDMLEEQCKNSAPIIEKNIYLFWIISVIIIIKLSK